MSKYSILLDVLDRIREEARGTNLSSKYLPAVSDQDLLNQARARAFIHLFIKVRFGVLDFSEREHFVTDGTQDGGIDGYFIDVESRVIYLIQSKFRTTESNFESKRIELNEILAMDVDRILGGEANDERGVPYSGKIQQLTREIRQVDDIARYTYRVVLLANLQSVSDAKLRQLSGGYSVEVMNHERCYNDLVFPVISGTFFNASDVNIYMDLSNKNAGSKISYTVATAQSDCEITVLFVPTIEIAKVLSKYKNSILRYNPRSYLDLEGKKVNAEIRLTILKQSTNEFALFNNGITMLSDETYINERIGQKNKAQLTLRNPQIINGGQTAYTLSRILEEQSGEDPQRVFDGKEVLLKVITFLESQQDAADKTSRLSLIDQISAATNQQTAVITADRHSNDSVFLEIQGVLFDRYGILFERKRGEFEDGLHKGYLSKDQVLERNQFFRLFLAGNGDLHRAVTKKLFTRLKDPAQTIRDTNKLDRFYFAYLLSLRIGGDASTGTFQSRSELCGKLYAMILRYFPQDVSQMSQAIGTCVTVIDREWNDFVASVARNSTKHFVPRFDRLTGDRREVFSTIRWMKSRDYPNDIRTHFS